MTGQVRARRLFSLHCIELRTQKRAARRTAEPTALWPWRRGREPVAGHENLNKAPVFFGKVRKG